MVENIEHLVAEQPNSGCKGPVKRINRVQNLVDLSGVKRQVRMLKWLLTRRYVNVWSALVYGVL